MVDIKSILKKHYLLILFCLFYTALSFLLYKDFGITTDEPTEYLAARALKERYLTNQTKEYFSSYYYHQNPYVAPYFRGHLLLLSIFNPSDSFEIFHLLNMLFGLGVFIVTYVFLFKITGKPAYSIIGPLLLLMFPRFSGDIPANPKDVPFAFFYFLGIFLIHVFSTEKIDYTKRGIFLRTIALGIVIGIAQSMRLLGASLLPIYVIYYLVLNLKHTRILSVLKGKNFWLFTLELLFISMIAMGFMIITMPYFWSNPLIQLIQYFRESVSFKAWDGVILFMGDFLTRVHRPDIYLPFLLIITTPLYIIVLSAYMLVKVNVFMKKPVWCLFTLTLAINLASYFIFKPIVYNNIRHFLFLLPIINVLASMSLMLLINEVFGRDNGADNVSWIKESGSNGANTTNRAIRVGKIPGIVLISIVVSSYLLTFARLTHLHPYQYIYFNEFTLGLHNSASLFDTDYWGATYTEAAKWLRDNTNGPVKVFTCNARTAMTYYLKERALIADEIADADYIVCDIDREKKRKIFINPIHEIKREGITILKIGKSGETIRYL